MLLLLISTGCEVAWQAAPGAMTQGQAPELSVTAPQDGAELLLGAQVSLVGEVVDDQAGVRVLVTSDVDGELGEAQVEGQDWSMPLALSQGDHTLTITAIDASQNRSALTWSLSQLGDQPPTLPELRIEPGDPVNGEPLALVIDVPSVDPEGAEVTTTIQWARDGVAMEAYADEDTVPLGVVQNGEAWTATQTVSDGNLSTSASVEVLVDGSGPVVQISLDPAAPSAADPIRCTWDAFDPDGDPVVSESGSWFVDGEDRGDAGTPLAPQPEGSLVRCEVSASSGEVTTRSVSVEVVNAPPVVDQVELSGAPAQEEDSLGCTAQASDLEGDSVQIDLAWFVNGAQVAIGEFLDGADFDRGNEVWCQATARDDAGSSEPVESEHTFILNTPPGKPVMTLSPDPAVPGELLTCSPQSTPSDVDPFDTLTLTYVWKVNSVNQGVNDPEFDTTGLSGGDTVWCKLKITDGTDLVSGVAELDLDQVLGGTLALSDGDLQILGSENKAAFGHAVLSPGDLDGDGVPELLVSGDGYSSGRGAVWFFDGAALGSSQDDADADAWWRGDSGGDGLGADQGIAVAGDPDDDGVADLLMAAPTAEGGGTERGVVYLLSGAESGSWGSGVDVGEDAVLTVSGGTNKDRLGSGLASMDLDGDGVHDLLLGAPYEDSTAGAAGAVCVFYGSAGLSGDLNASDADITLLGSASTDRMGLNSPRPLGDVDGDGQDDLMVGSYNADSSAGTAYIMDPSTLSSGTAEGQAWMQFDGASNDNLAMSAVSLSDLDGDGADELLLGARTASVDTAEAGGVYFFFGDAAWSGAVSVSSADASWGASDSNARLGWDLSVGDVDGDGVQDWSSGAYATASPNNSGSAWLVSGAGYTGWTTGMNIADSARAEVKGDSGGMYVGRTPFILADMNGDGANEWMVSGEGVARGSTKRAGQVSIFYGP